MNLILESNAHADGGRADSESKRQALMAGLADRERVSRDAGRGGGMSSIGHDSVCERPAAIRIDDQAGSRPSWRRADWARI